MNKTLIYPGTKLGVPRPDNGWEFVSRASTFVSPSQIKHGHSGSETLALMKNSEDRHEIFQIIAKGLIYEFRCLTSMPDSFDNIPQVEQALTDMLRQDFIMAVRVSSFSSQKYKMLEDATGRIIEVVPATIIKDHYENGMHALVKFGAIDELPDNAVAGLGYSNVFFHRYVPLVDLQFELVREPDHAVHA